MSNLKRYDVRIVGLSGSGQTFRAKDQLADRMYNIPVQEAETCQVKTLDGTTETGLEVGKLYQIAGEVSPQELDDGGCVFILRPMAAKEYQVTIDFDALELDVDLPNNVRPPQPMQMAAQAVGTTKGKVAATAADDVPPF